MTTLLALDGSDKRELLRTAAAVESRSSHPLAQAAIRKAEAEGVDDLPEAGELQSVTGRGGEQN